MFDYFLFCLVCTWSDWFLLLPCIGAFFNDDGEEICVVQRTGQGCETEEEDKEIPCSNDAGDEEQCQNFPPFD